MQLPSNLHRQTRSLATAMLFLLCAGSAMAMDSYNPANGQLTIAAVNIGGQLYFGMVVTIGNVLGVQGGAPDGLVDNYDPVSDQLTVPAVAVGGTIYYNVTATVGGLVQLPDIVNYVYDGTNVHLEFVQVGSRFYQNVIATVGNVIRFSFAMPAAGWPEYNPTTSQLTIPAVGVRQNAYAFDKDFVTNAFVTISKVISVGGTASIVPDVIGATQAGAATAITGAGLTVGTVTAQPSGTVAAGSVISANPAATTLVASGTAVALVVSAGPVAQESILYSFAAPGLGPYCLFPDGVSPSGLIPDSNGDFYGTTRFGGGTNEGTFFRVTPSGALTVLHSFSGYNADVGCGTGTTTDGEYPQGPPLLGKDGNFYVNASYDNAAAAGAIFRFGVSGAESILYTSGPELNPNTLYPSDLIQDTDLNFYGTSSGGGPSNSGALFSITQAGAATVIYWFQGHDVSSDGFDPLSLVQGKDGNFYGTTECGGVNDIINLCESGGTVFKITPAGAETVLHDFGFGADGADPAGILIQGSDGNFFGLTEDGGTGNCGIVFAITPSGGETVMHSFEFTDGCLPTGLIEGSDRNFYGTTSEGGAFDAGTLFRISPAGIYTLLYSFAGFAGVPGSPDGAGPTGLIEGSDGSLYGTTATGGPYNAGTIYKLSGVVPVP
jgi:uncharacterized repeat protein (TIGR03803 family)